MFSLKTMHLNMLPAKWHQFCSGFKVVNTKTCSKSVLWVCGKSILSLLKDPFQLQILGWNSNLIWICCNTIWISPAETATNSILVGAIPLQNCSISQQSVYYHLNGGQINGLVPRLTAFNQKFIKIWRFRLLLIDLLRLLSIKSGKKAECWLKLY